MTTCKREADHQLPAGFAFARRGCDHQTAESMPFAQFTKLPLVRCTKCSAPLGRVCPDCKRVY